MTCASVPAPERRSADGALEPGVQLVALRDRAAGLGHRRLDVGAALVASSRTSTSSALTIWPFGKAISWTMPGTLAVTMIDSKARTVPTASRVSTTRPVLTVSTSTVAGACGAAATAAGSRRRCTGAGAPGGGGQVLRRVLADVGRAVEVPFLPGVPAAVACSAEHGDDGKLSVPAHARSLTTGDPTGSQG